MIINGSPFLALIEVYFTIQASFEIIGPLTCDILRRLLVACPLPVFTTSSRSQVDKWEAFEGFAILSPSKRMCPLL